MSDVSATNNTVTKKAAGKSPSPEKGPPAIRLTNGIVSSIKVRMYRGGTGDFFLLQFKAGGRVVFNMMIDCGCIKGGASTFAPLIADLKKETRSIIDLLVVTHEHADHINGFEHSAELFKSIQFKKVWFAWTEDNTDKTANEYRKKYAKTKFALAEATRQLNGLAESGYYRKTFEKQAGLKKVLDAQELFQSSMNELTALNGKPLLATGSKIPTMADRLKQYNVIKPGTQVEFLSPGDMRLNLPNAAGIRFFVLGPPRDLDNLSAEGKAGEGYSKRAEASSVHFALVNALTSGTNTGSTVAFDADYEVKTEASEIATTYTSEPWRQIDHDWLSGTGSLALRLQQSINNTSLALAIQFEQSEKVLLFPGDAEYGNWISWHEGLEWTIQKDGKTKKVNAAYLLNHTVFYKVGHHLSQNGTAKSGGLELMQHEELTAMATLDFKKINSGWLNTMPNDLIGAELIHKTAGRLFFVGDYKQILKNIKTSRVTVKLANEANFIKLNKEFEGKPFIDWEVKA